MPDFDAVIIGAGAAGLGAAAALRARGKRAILLEAGARVGGRALTVRPDWLDGAVDLGASWFHAAGRNALARMAGQAGIRTRRFAPEARLTALPCEPDAGAPSWIADDAGREEAEAAFEAATDASSSLPDMSMLEALRRGGARHCWLPGVATFEGALISAADASDLSLADWRENALDDDNLWVPEGMGHFVETCLAAPVRDDVRLNWRVDAIDWDAPGGGVAVRGPQGVVRAACCIVTVSTGVLRSGAIRFTRPLPGPHQEALERLPMGLLSKIVFPARNTDFAAMAPDTSVHGFVRDHGDAAMFFLARPMGLDAVIGFCGGRAAWHVAQGSEALAEFCRAELARYFGARARGWIGDAALCSDWGRDRLFAGAYSYGIPGCGDARSDLRAAVGDGRLRFAGEACCRGMAGTVHGAWETGQSAAMSVA